MLRPINAAFALGILFQPILVSNNFLQADGIAKLLNTNPELAMNVIGSPQTDLSEDDQSGEISDSATPQEPQSDNSEGATSFSNLCNNGLGKPEGAPRKKRSGMFGLADRLSAFTRKIPLVGDFLVDSANSLSQEIACKLYPEEQKQAAEATLEATRGEEIGKVIEWKSTVRDNVSGSSTVTDKEQLSDGRACLTLADVIIVEGEELKVTKQMCRLPGEARYTIMTA